MLELYDFYAHGKITKREFLEKAGRFTAGGLTAVAVLGMMSPDYALAEQVSFNDPEIKGEYVMYPSPNGHGEVRGYLVGLPMPPANCPLLWLCMKTAA